MRDFGVTWKDDRVTLAPNIEPIPADDDLLRNALADAEIPALLAATAHVTGDLSVLRPGLRPDPARLREPQGGLDEAQLAEGRTVAFDALTRWRDATRCTPQQPTDESLRVILDFCTGTTVDDRYVPLLREELAIEGDRLRAPDWSKSAVAPDRPFTVAIIGAGMSGIAAAHRLKQAGVDFTVIEKNDDVGGTWYENTYPGCRVDVQNHMYSFSFAQKHDWPYYHSPRQVLQQYFRQCAEEFGLMSNIHFTTEVLRAEWNDDSGEWNLTVRGPGGERTVTAHAVVSAVGQLNRPRWPDLAGMKDFAGPYFHSAEWDDTIPLDGKKVAVIGTGASVCQFIPIVAQQAEHLSVFQRTAPWLIPSPRYQQAVEPGFRWLLGHVPFYAQWYRFFLFWRGAEGLIAAATVDPSFPPSERSVSKENEEIRVLLTEWLKFTARDDDELLAKITPNYPPLSKRFVLDDGIWGDTLARPNVDLVTVGIDRIEARRRSYHRWRAARS